MPIPEIRIPVLKDGSLLELSFSFYTPEPLDRVWAYLRASSVNRSSPVKLRIIRFSVETAEGDTAGGFRLHRLLVKEKADGRAPNHMEGQYSPGWTVIRFFTGRLECRYDQYLLYLRLRAREPELLPGRETPVCLGGSPVHGMWRDGSRLEREAIFLVPRRLLKENDANLIRFKVDESLMPAEPPRLREKNGRGLELLDLDVRPALPSVAHAGGRFRGLTYTNSVEALTENAANFSLFEIDFQWTRDGRLVGLHDWGKVFTRLFGFETESPLALEAFRELETACGVTPLSIDSLTRFLADNPPARIVTDVKTDNIQALRNLAQRVPDFDERIIAQVYQPDEFLQAVEIGYEDIIWTLYRYPFKYDAPAILSQIEHWEERHNCKPFGIVMPVPVVEKGIAAIVARAGIPVYVHTVNTCAEYRRLIWLGVSSVYTDFLNIGTCYAPNPPCPPEGRAAYSL
jgi:glycerophosphoryl diester phosphodiesterase